MALNTTKDDAMQEQILKAAQLLFQKHGRNKVSLDDVSKAIGKGRSSLYYYYKNKEEIWAAVIEQEFDEIVAEVNKAVELAFTIEDKIRAFCNTKLRMLRQKRALYNAMVGNDEANRPRPNYTRRNRYLKKESVILSKILTDGMEKGQIRELEVKELEILVFVLISGLHGLEKETNLDKGHNIESSINVLTNMIMHGLSA